MLTHKRKTFILVFSVVAACAAFAVRVAASEDAVRDIVSDTTWTLEGSPYLIEGAVYVQDGATLAVEPGVVVMFGPDASLVVKGSFAVSGTADEPVRFSSVADGSATSPRAGDYSGIVIQEGAHASFRYADIRYATVALSVRGDLSLEDSRLSYNTHGLLQTAGSLAVVRSTFSDNYIPLKISFAVDFACTDARFSGNAFDGIGVGSYRDEDGDIVFPSCGTPYYLLSDILMHGSSVSFEPGVELLLPPEAFGEPQIVMYGGFINAVGAENAVVSIAPHLQGYAGVDVEFSHADAAYFDLSGNAVLSMHNSVSAGFRIADHSTAVVRDTAFVLDMTGIDVSGSSELDMRDSSIADPVRNEASQGALMINHVSSAYLENVAIASVNTAVSVYKNSMFEGYRIGVMSTDDDAFDLGSDILQYTEASRVKLRYSRITGSLHGFKTSDMVPLNDIEFNAIEGNQYGAFNRGIAPALFANNWWGDPTGPTHAGQNPDGLGDTVTDGIVFTPWLTYDPAPDIEFPNIGTQEEVDDALDDEESEAQPDGTGSDTGDSEPDDGSSGESHNGGGEESQDATPLPVPGGGGGGGGIPPSPAPVPERARPVIIIPGILGTELFLDASRLWLDIVRTVSDRGDQFMDPLAFTEQLRPSVAGVRAGDIVREKLVVFGKPHFDYSQKLLDELAARGYREGADVFVFPYDWRYGVEHAAADLAQTVDTVLRETGSDTVDIVAHSMGGLVLKKYAMSRASESHIGKAILVGVPQTGAPQAAKTLLEGSSFGVPFLSEKEIKKLARNMPSVHDLLPSRRYVAQNGGYASVFGGAGGAEPIMLSFESTTQYLIDDHGQNAAALAAADALHSDAFDAYDLRSSGIDVYAINGCRAGTIGAFSESRGSGADAQPASYAIISEVPGDGIVPLASASDVGVDRSKEYYALSGTHTAMLVHDGVRRTIAGILSGETVSAFGDITQDSSLCGLNGKFISVSGPLSLEVTDQYGNRAVFDAENDAVENTIPNADYQIFGGRTFVYVPTDAGQLYDVRVQATGTGTASVTVETIARSSPSATESFRDILVKQGLSGHIYLEDPARFVFDIDSALIEAHDVSISSLQDDSPSETPAGVVSTEAIEPIRTARLKNGASAIGSGYMPSKAALFSVSALMVALALIFLRRRGGE